MLQNLLKYISVVSVEQKKSFFVICVFTTSVFSVFSVVKNYLRKLNI